MADHDPIRFASDLSAKLATRSRHVCAFLGAGVARACGLPDIAQLQTRVLAGLNKEDSEAFAKQVEGRNLEQALSRLRRMATLLTDTQTIDDLTSEQAVALDKVVCQLIVDELKIKGDTDLVPVEHFAAWAGRTRYRLPVEIFTVNYDLLLETALETRRVPYFDGFVGTLRARFHIELVEGTPGTDHESMPAFFVRLWKLHGSVNWAWEDQHILRLGQPVNNALAAAIYPSDTKYEESRRVPFVVLQDRLRRALQQPETMVIIAGYSFSDEHLNELLFDAAARRERSEFLAFCYSTIPEALASRALTTPNLQVVNGEEAILGGIRAPWKAPSESTPNLWENGKLALCDFRNLAAYLARSSVREDEKETPMRGEPIQSLGAGSGGRFDV
jgi:SIR2-like domain